MIRMCTLIALFELALLGALSGMSSVQADPGDECCGMPKHEDCNGCVGPYLIDGGVLFGCTTASIAADCNITSQVCATVIGPAQRWKRGSNCTIPNGILMGEADILKPGCVPTECD